MTCPCGQPILARGLCGTHYARWRKSGDPRLDEPVSWDRRRGARTDLFTRLLDKTEAGNFKDGDFCFLWRGTCNPKGYGSIRDGNLTRSVHRVMYELYYGAIPDGMDIDHLCRVRNCVNPHHLEPVTHAENVRRGAASRKLEAAK